MNTETKLSVTFGYPEFWQQIHGNYGGVFAALPRLRELANQLIREAEHKAAEPAHKVVTALTRLVCNSFTGVITLAGNGQGHDAMKIVRSMFETSIHAEYLRQYPEEVDDFLQHGHITQWTRYNYLLRSSPARAAELPSQKIKELHQNYLRALPRFQLRDRNGKPLVKRDGTPKLRGRWHKKSLRQMARAVGMEESYELIYSLTSSIQHGNFEALLCWMTGHMDAPIFDAPPSTNWIEQALISGHVYVLRCLETLNTALTLGFDQQLGEAVKGFQRIWGRSPVQS